MMNANIFYFDNAATTPLDPSVSNTIQQVLAAKDSFGNPSSLHIFGEIAAQYINTAKKNLANLINAEPLEITFTSGATESIHLALKGAALAYQHLGKHIISTHTEHQASLSCLQELSNLGFEISLLKPLPTGQIDIQAFKQQLREDTILVSLTHVNNETGVIQSLTEITTLLKDSNALLHVDAAQSLGKIDIDVELDKIDLLSLSAHKIYGPKGIGALYVRQKTKTLRLHPMLTGGGQQKFRSGTLATHQIIGLGEAAKICKLKILEDSKKINSLQNILLDTLQTIDGFKLNVARDNCVPHILNFRIENIHPECLVTALRFIACSQGSACHAKLQTPSHVLTSLGLNARQAMQSLRLSMGRFTTIEEVNEICSRIKTAILRLQGLSYGI